MRSGNQRKKKGECLTCQLLFCNNVSVVGWSGCDQIMRLTESLLLIVVWFWSNKFGGDGLRNRRRSCRCKWGLGISERKMWVSCTPVALLQLCECCWLIWMRSNNETYRIPVVAPLRKLRQVNFFWNMSPSLDCQPCALLPECSQFSVQASHEVPSEWCALSLPCYLHEC